MPRCSDEDTRTVCGAGGGNHTPKLAEFPTPNSRQMPCPSAKIVHVTRSASGSPGLEPLRIAKPIPAFLDGSKRMFAGNKLYLLLAFVPLAFLSEHLEWAPATIFGIACLAILPLAGLLGEATEQADR